jgi:hypothetical protein
MHPLLPQAGRARISRFDASKSGTGDADAPGQNLGAQSLSFAHAPQAIAELQQELAVQTELTSRESIWKTNYPKPAGFGKYAFRFPWPRTARTSSQNDKSQGTALAFAEKGNDQRLRRLLLPS